MRLIDADELLKKQYLIDDSATLSARNVVNVEDIEEALPVDVLNKIKDDIHSEIEDFGHWEYVQYDSPNIGNYHCSECRETFPVDCSKWNYCPNCGAKMEEDK